MQCWRSCSRGAAPRPVVPTHGHSWLEPSASCAAAASSVCPTGAIHEQFLSGAPAGHERALVKTRTTCTFCGVGCQIDLNVDRRRSGSSRSRRRPGYVSNDGNLCVKGRFAFDFIHHPDRLTTPLVRGEDGELPRPTWDDGSRAAAERLPRSARRHGPQSIGVLASARCTNEENYLLQKLARAVIDDQLDRLTAPDLTRPTVAGLATNVGSGAMTNSIPEIVDADVLLVIGSNTTEAHPIIRCKMKKAVRKGAKLIVADPRTIGWPSIAHLHLQLRPGTDVCAGQRMLHVIIRRGWHDEAYIARAHRGLRGRPRDRHGLPARGGREITGVPAEDIRAAAREYATTPQAGDLLHARHHRAHLRRPTTSWSLANLVLLTGHIGYPAPA